MQMINTRYDQKIAIFPIGVIYVQKWPKLPKNGNVHEMTIFSKDLLIGLMHISVQNMAEAPKIWTIENPQIKIIRRLSNLVNWILRKWLKKMCR